MLKIAYLTLATVMTLIIIAIFFSAIGRTSRSEKEKSRFKWTTVTALLGWHGYMAALGRTGVVETFALPPRFAVLLILPAFAFTGVFAWRVRNSDWLSVLPPRWLVYYQSFRIAIEAIFVWSVAEGILHYHVTIEGYNYDMIFGALTPLVAYLVFQRKALPQSAAIAWNFLGLAVIAVIIFLFLSTIYAPTLYGASGAIAPLDFTAYPYLLVPGFLMPSAVFMHVLSLTQLFGTRRGVT